MATPHVSGTAALCIATGRCAGGPSSVMSKLRSDAVAQLKSYGFTGDPSHAITQCNPKRCATLSSHGVAGSLRSGPLPSAEIDASGKVYVVWQDCRFEVRCTANDIVMSTSTDGVTWSSVVRIPIDAIGSGVDHFIPSLAANPGTSGATAHLGLTYYYYPNANCSTSTCQLNVGIVSSSDGGNSWTLPTQLAGPMTVTWLPNTTQGYMVGDYISTSFSGGTAHGVFAVANAPSGGLLDEAMYTPSSGLAAAATSSVTISSRGEVPVPNAAPDHAPSAVPVTRR